MNPINAWKKNGWTADWIDIWNKGTLLVCGFDFFLLALTVSPVGWDSGSILFWSQIFGCVFWILDVNLAISLLGRSRHYTFFEKTHWMNLAKGKALWLWNQGRVLIHNDPHICSCHINFACHYAIKLLAVNLSFNMSHLEAMNGHSTPQYNQLIEHVRTRTKGGTVGSGWWRYGRPVQVTRICTVGCESALWTQFTTTIPIISHH